MAVLAALVVAIGMDLMAQVMVVSALATLVVVVLILVVLTTQVATLTLVVSMIVVFVRKQLHLFVLEPKNLETVLRVRPLIRSHSRFSNLLLQEVNLLLLLHDHFLLLQSLLLVAVDKLDIRPREQRVEPNLLAVLLQRTVHLQQVPRSQQPRPVLQQIREHQEQRNENQRVRSEENEHRADLHLTPRTRHTPCSSSPDSSASSPEPESDRTPRTRPSNRSWRQI